MIDTILTAYRGEKGDPGDGTSIAIHESSSNSHPDLRALITSKATNYKHDQTTASTSWVINHNLNKYPTIVSILPDGTEVQGRVIYNSYNVCSIVFAVAIYGTAYCV